MRILLLALCISFATILHANEDLSQKNKLQKLEFKKTKGDTASAVGITATSLQVPQLYSSTKGVFRAETLRSKILVYGPKTPSNANRAIKVTKILEKSAKTNAFVRLPAFIASVAVTSFIVNKNLKTRKEIDDFISCNPGLAKSSQPSNKIDKESKDLISTINFMKEVE